MLNCLIIFSSVSLIKAENHGLSADDVVQITITPSPEEDGSWLVGTELEFTLQDHEYNKVQIKLVGSTRAFMLDLKFNRFTDIWSIKWDTGRPSDYDPDPVPAGTYDLTLIINYLAYESNPSEIVITTEGNPMLIVMLLIIIIGVVGAGGGLVFVKKRKSKADGLEFGTVDKTKKKKKGQIYSGASSIGKRSGSIAEDKVKSKTAALESDESKKSSIKSKIGSKIKKSTAEAPKQMMPADSNFTFETTESKSTFMMKSMESSMDLENKVKFMISRTESVVQNVEFFKAILSQQQQTELVCPECERTMSGYWAECPYCKVEGDEELALKYHVLEISDEVRFCPSCKRLIKPNWIECPICFLRE